MNKYWLLLKTALKRFLELLEKAKWICNAITPVDGRGILPQT
jgi:hypothetical protein